RFSEVADCFQWMFRKHERRLWRFMLVLAVVIPAILVGQQAVGGWQTDPLFHKDISFFVEVFPFHVMVVNLLTQAVTYGLWIAVVAGYWYGGWRFRRGGRKVIKDFTRRWSVWLGG